MIGSVITALILIGIVLLAICGLLAWRVHELGEDLDLVTRELIDILSPPANTGERRLRSVDNAERLWPGQPG